MPLVNRKDSGGKHCCEGTKMKIYTNSINLNNTGNQMAKDE